LPLYDDSESDAVVFNGKQKDVIVPQYSHRLTSHHHYRRRPIHGSDDSSIVEDNFQQYNSNPDDGPEQDNNHFISSPALLPSSTIYATRRILPTMSDSNSASKHYQTRLKRSPTAELGLGLGPSPSSPEIFGKRIYEVRHFWETIRCFQTRSAFPALFELPFVQAILTKYLCRQTKKYFTRSV
jgi:hypothetical protein